MYANRAAYAKEIPNMLNSIFITFATKYKFVNKKTCSTGR